YDKLFIDDKGAVSITIINPENSGVNFTSSFTFYNSKGEYLTGFTIEGSSPRNSRKTYNLHLNNYKKMKTAFYMKVLGRSGGPGA
ncbi:MAG: hypothetical protein LBQ58_05600, partial [Synergistaceae bacterium]|nr:hypothetical protein [Synergistaceae bacterium]